MLARAALIFGLGFGVTVGVAFAQAGPYDGTWAGSTAGNQGRCQGPISMTVTGGKVNGTRHSAVSTTTRSTG